MKQKIFIVLLFLEVLCLKCKAQQQEGQTCLFTCMNHICSSKTVFDYEMDYGGQQDVFNNGLKTTPRLLVSFINMEFETTRQTILSALDSGIQVLTTEHCDGHIHSIVLEKYFVKEGGVTLMFYDPMDGRQHYVGYAEFIQNKPIYIIPCKN